MNLKLVASTALLCSLSLPAMASEALSAKITAVKIDGDNLLVKLNKPMTGYKPGCVTSDFQWAIYHPSSVSKKQELKKELVMFAYKNGKTVDIYSGGACSAGSNSQVLGKITVR